MASLGEGALTSAMDKLRKVRDRSTNNKRMRKGTKNPKGSHRPNQSRSRKDIMDSLT
jgi:hypothetical protein